MAAEFKLTYGLFVIGVNDTVKDSGCICNTVGQVTTSPNRLSITLNKTNYTTEVIEKTGILNISVLSEKAPFAIFKRFGFQSGRDTDKFEGFDAVRRSANGLLYLTEAANAFFSAKVVQTIDLGTHYMFIADVTESGDISSDPSATYAFYHAHIKPKPEQKKEAVGTIWRCRICGYEYKGEVLPPDFVCPICKHGAEDFEKVQ